VRVSGHPKVQETFARVMGYVEQFDVHSPNVRRGPTCTACHPPFILICAPRQAVSAGLLQERVSARDCHAQRSPCLMFSAQETRLSASDLQQVVNCNPSTWTIDRITVVQELVHGHRSHFAATLLAADHGVRVAGILSAPATQSRDGAGDHLRIRSGGEFRTCRLGVLRGFVRLQHQGFHMSRPKDTWRQRCSH
jgi:hypothetical protein